MKTNILWLHELRFVDVAFAGRKAANLGELLWKGFPVPSGFVLSAEAYKTMFQAANLYKELRNLDAVSPHILEARCKQIQQKIFEQDLPEDLIDDILQAHQTFTQHRDRVRLCVIRSSATTEDLKKPQFVGHHATYYYVDESHLLQMIKHCWTSLWNPAVVAYRAAHGLDHTMTFMAVIVQEMVASDMAGMVYTRNLETGSAEEIVIESSWGMGAAVVSGRVIPDRYIITRHGLRLQEQRIARKRFMVPAHLKEAGQGRLEDVPYALQQQATLSPDSARAIAEWALKAEEHFGPPQNLEWAIANGHVHFLQTQPLSEAQSTEELDLPPEPQKPYVLHRAFLEHSSEPLTPLTTDLFSCVSLRGVRFIRGWIYYDLAYLRLLLPFTVSDQRLIQIFHNDVLPRFSLKDLSLYRLLLCRIFAAYVSVLTALFRKRTRTWARDHTAPFRTIHGEFEGSTEANPPEMIRRLLHFPSFLAAAGSMPFLFHMFAIRYFFLEDRIHRLLKRWFPKIRTDAAMLLCRKNIVQANESLEQGLIHLVREVQASPRTRQLFFTHKLDQLLPELRAEPESHQFLEVLSQFLKEHGHHTSKELDLQSVHWEEDPVQIFGIIRNALFVDFPSHPSQDSGSLELEADIRQQLRKRPFEPIIPFRWLLIHSLMWQARRLFTLLENANSYTMTALYCVRKKILKLEVELVRQGKLRCKDDIFFLHWDEITKLEAGQLTWRDVEDRIRKRRITHAQFARVSPPRTIGLVAEPSAEASPALLPEGLVFQGKSGSSGRYEGQAHVILDPSMTAELKPGEILVAPATDPTWVTLLFHAGALVVEQGHSLSHAATMGRTYGKPCVVGVADCTKRIQTGDRLSIDADQGTVRVLFK